jgi:GntR family transcriptional regulator
LFESIAPETAGMPLYQVVRRSLRKAIASGSFPPGAMLPSETDLATRMGVSIGTLRRAVDDLAAEHLLVRRQGRGTFVTPHPAPRPAWPWFQVERDDGRREPATTELLSFGRRAADAALAAALHLSAGDAVFHIEQLLRLQGHAVVHERVCLPIGPFATLTEEWLRAQPGPAPEWFQSGFGVTVLRSRERARAAAADPHAAQLLGVAVGAPVLRVHATALTFDERPVAHRICTVNTAHHDCVSDVSRPAPQHD